MNLSMRGRILTAVVGGAVLVGGATAQNDPATRHSGERAAIEAKSIVVHDDDGRMVIPGELPAIVAYEKLDLDRPTRDKIGVIIDERGVLADRVLADHLDVIFALRENMPHLFDDLAPKTRPSMYARAARGKFLDAAEDLLDRGSLRAEISENLGDDDRDEYLAMLREYDLAIADERARARGMGANRPNSPEDTTEEGDEDRAPNAGNHPPAGSGLKNPANRMRDVAREVARAYDRVVAVDETDVEAFVSRMDLEPELEGKVTIAAFDAMTKRELNPEADAGDPIVIGTVLTALTPAERRALLKQARAAWGAGAS